MVAIIVFPNEHFPGGCKIKVLDLQLEKFKKVKVSHEAQKGRLGE